MRRTLLNCLLAALAGCGGGTVANSTDAPEFTHHAASEWLNSTPLTLSELRGRVVLIEFWTFDCYNCRNTLPWLKAVHAAYRDQGLTVVSVHTPEFEHERDPQQVRAAILKLGIEYQVMLDNDSSYWRALDNRYWPAFYLVDRQGKIVASTFGELHRGERRGDEFEQRIRAMLGARRPN
jgi:thiol-disulfide isomerase/thioredoxin